MFAKSWHTDEYCGTVARLLVRASLQADQGASRPP